MDKVNPMTRNSSSFLIRLVSALLLPVIGISGSRIQLSNSRYPLKTLSGAKTKRLSRENIDVNLKLINKSSYCWEFEVVVENQGQEPVLIMTDPIRIDGSRGIYMSVAKEDPSTLELSIRLYDPPPYFLYVDKTRVRAAQLAPGAIHSERFVVNFPYKETFPPYGEYPVQRQVDNAKIKFMKVFVGVLPDEQGIRELLQHKVSNYVVNGYESLLKGRFKGKHLIDLQTVFSSKKVEL
jgi:hypothetical protein